MKLVEMHIKRERTHGKEGIFKDEKYKCKGYEEPEVFCIFISWFCSVFIQLLEGTLFSNTCITVA